MPLLLYKLKFVNVAGVSITRFSWPMCTVCLLNHVL